MCYFPKSNFTRCSFDLRLFIAPNCLRDHELQEERSRSSLWMGWLCLPITFAQEIQPRRFLLGFFAWGCSSCCFLVFATLDRAYSWLVIQKPRQPEPGRHVGLSLCCEKAYVGGKSLHYEFRQSLWLHAGGSFIRFPEPGEAATWPLWGLRGPQRILIVFLPKLSSLLGSCSIPQCSGRDT